MEIMAEEELPRCVSGFRFNPMDEELIRDYLKPKIVGKQLPCDIIKETQVYGPSFNPWHVFDPNDIGNSWLISPSIKPPQKFMFVFAKLSKICDSKNTGFGTWVAKGKREQILDGKGDVIGESRYLVFEINKIDAAAAGVGFYGMHEYSLSGVNQGLDSAEDTITVLCKITYDSSKKTMISCKNLEGTGSVTAAENLTVLDSGVDDGSATVQLSNGLDDFDGDFSLADLVGVEFNNFNDWVLACLQTNQAVEPFQDNTINLRKRKFQLEENSYLQAKKMCLDNYH